MQAIVQDEYGPPESLQLREIDNPSVDENGVLVRIRAASVNALDWHLTRGEPPVMRMFLGRRAPKVRVRGVDLAGQVEAVGRNVTRFKPGDEVFGAGPGTFAEYVVSSEKRLAAKPRNASFEVAAAIPVAALTALQGLRDKARVIPGQKVLVHGAGGGVGTFAVQIAKWLGAHVTATTSTKNLDLVRSIGADEALDYTQEDFATRGQRYDVLFDLGGNRSLADCRAVLSSKGTLVLAAAASGGGLAPLTRPLRALLWSPFVSQRLIPLLTRSSHEDLVVLKDLVEAGKLTSVIDRRYPLADVPAAIRYVGTGEARGKVVINVA